MFLYWLQCHMAQFLCDVRRLLCPRDSPGENTGVGCHALLQGIFLTQGSNPLLLHCRILFALNHLGSPSTLLLDVFYVFGGKG